ncbi:MAG: alternative ribosome rescue aminoacyl-tRNA hydrolase ArfB [bacterium]
MTNMEKRGTAIGQADMGSADPKPESGPGFVVPESEVRIEFARSSGPGGQNVNKRATKAVLTWSVGLSSAFDDRQKDMIRAALANRINADDEIVLAAQTERSQSQNREDVLRRLNELVAAAVTPQKPRRPTRPSRAERERRLEEKSKVSRKKALRKGDRDEW